MAVKDMGSTNMALLVVIVTVATVVSFIVMVMMCSWCVKWLQRRKRVSEEEEILSRSYRSVEHGEDNDVRQLQRRSWEEKAKSGSFNQGSDSPVLTRKTIKFERPERRVVTEHVQPQASSHTSLNSTLAARREAYQATTQHRPPPSAKASTSAASVGTSGPEAKGLDNMASTKSHSNSTDSQDENSVWKGVRNLATMFMDEGVEETSATAPIQVEGIDYQLGKLQIALSYDFQTLTLTLKILQATHLPAKDFTGTSDPYVKILLLPDKKHKLLTKVKKKNLNPRWNECFLFEGWPHNKLLEKTLYLQVIDYDRFSRDDPIGETYIPLNEVDLSQSPMIWKYLSPCKDSRGKLGELLLSLCYEPNVGRLTVIVMKAKDLKAKDITGSSDPYVKLWLMYGKERAEKKKTSIKMRTLNPVFNETFIFEIQWDKIREAAIEVTCMDFDKLGRNEMIGKVLLGSKSGPLENRHWNDMISKPRQQVAQWHLLKD